MEIINDKDILKLGMDDLPILSSHYFKLPRLLQEIVGLWPFSGIVHKMCLRVFGAGVIIAMLLPQLYSLKRNYKTNRDASIYYVAIVMYCFLMAMKYYTSIISETKIKILYVNIQKNWEMIKNEEEIKILSDYSEYGVVVIKYYLGILAWGYLSFLSYVFIPSLLDIISPLDHPREKQYLIDYDLGFNKDNYFVYCYLYDAVAIVMTGFLIAAVDITYMTSVQHCIGLFAIIKYRFEKVGELLATSQEKDDSYAKLIETIKLHHKVLICAELMENTYSTSFFVLCGVIIIYFTFTCVSVLIVFAKKEAIAMIRFSIVGLGCVCQMFFLSFPGQRLIDCSSQIYFDVYNNYWYATSKKTKTLLKIIFLRCYVHCQLTAGGLFVMGFENFMKIMKTAVSYITVLSSFR